MVSALENVNSLIAEFLKWNIPENNLDYFMLVNNELFAGKSKQIGPDQTAPTVCSCTLHTLFLFEKLGI